MHVLAHGLEVGSARPWSEPEFHLIPGTNSVYRAVPETFSTVVAVQVVVSRFESKHSRDRGPYLNSTEKVLSGLSLTLASLESRAFSPMSPGREEG